MIIDTKGNRMLAVSMYDGVIVQDGSYAIFVEYKPEHKAAVKEILNSKSRLSETDYKAIKHADGALSDEEYEPVRAERQKLRERIRELEGMIETPTLTKEEIAAAEAAAEGR